MVIYINYLSNSLNFLHLTLFIYLGKGTESQDHLYSGCLKNLQILDGNGTYNNINQPDVTGIVETGCQDKCLKGNQCNAETPCTNFYSHVKCDCFGTNLQGPFCNQSGIKQYNYTYYRGNIDQKLFVAKIFN